MRTYYDPKEIDGVDEYGAIIEITELRLIAEPDLLLDLDDQSVAISITGGVTSAGGFRYFLVTVDFKRGATEYQRQRAATVLSAVAYDFAMQHKWIVRYAIKGWNVE